MTLSTKHLILLPLFLILLFTAIRKSIRWLIRLCILAALAGALTLGLLTHTAAAHGRYDSAQAITVDHILNSPAESVLPDDLNGALVIYYKYGCSDCEAVFQSLTAALSGNPDVYWVSTRSDQGQALLQDFPVSEVPSGIYIYEKSDKSLTFIQKVLYTSDRDGNISLDTDALETLLTYQRIYRQEAEL